MTSPLSRRTFDTTFKLQVLLMVKEQGLSVSQVCRDMIWWTAPCTAG